MKKQVQDLNQKLAVQALQQVNCNKQFMELASVCAYIATQAKDVVIDNRVQQIIQRFKKGGVITSTPEIESMWAYDNLQLKGELIQAYQEIERLNKEKPKQQPDIE